MGATSGDDAGPGIELEQWAEADGPVLRDRPRDGRDLAALARRRVTGGERLSLEEPSGLPFHAQLAGTEDPGADAELGDRKLPRPDP